jgi:hypothetical protein
MTQQTTLPVLALRAAADEIVAMVEGVKKGKLVEALTYWKGTGDEYEAFDKERKRIGQALEDLSRKTIPEMMAEEGVKTITLEDIGYRFTVSQRFSCSMPDKEAGMEWLRGNGLGDLIQPTVNAQTLSSAMKKMIEDDGREPPSELFTTSYMSFTSATKAR